MKSKIYKFKAEVWKWPGYAGWHFVNVPQEISVKIKRIARTYGAGFVKVEATVGKSSWETALFPQVKSKSYLLSIKASIRKKENIFDRDKVAISFVLK